MKIWGDLTDISAKKEAQAKGERATAPIPVHRLPFMSTPGAWLSNLPIYVCIHTSISCMYSMYICNRIYSTYSAGPNHYGTHSAWLIGLCACFHVQCLAKYLRSFECPL